MPNYYCKCCNYSTHIITHFKKHLETNKHKKSTKSQQKSTFESTKSQHFLLLFYLSINYIKLYSNSIYAPVDEKILLYLLRI